ncbi:CNNM domain-containing protein [Clostridium sp.]|jgi:CBS domain containing-hemolysin-like protein|uniref:CNNM domain-containing protein n=1 Tax=Clostridium sp. TaxID=1506 RepID=UPI00258F1EC4|nr:CNNM domain-containing protein [Clostridium sp.]MDF2503332.1 hypothetical protein [Clostridium sp.]
MFNGGIIVSKKKNRKSNARSRRKWLLTILLWSVFISGSISLLSDSLLQQVNMVVAFVVLAFIIVVGIIFDIIGIAVTAANETPFHAMASKKIHGAKIAIRLIRNADKVSTFCNDVVGDISGIVSGSVGIFIAQKIVHEFMINSTVVNVGIGAVIASMTICGKAVGKTYALENDNKIVSKVSKLMYLIVKDR